MLVAVTVGGRTSGYPAAVDDPIDDLGMPKCPDHLETLHLFGQDDEGRDARWECTVPGCTWVQVA